MIDLRFSQRGVRPIFVQNPRLPYMHIEDQVLSRFNRVFKVCIRDTHEGVLFRQDINPRAPQDTSPCPNSPDMHTKCFELQMHQPAKTSVHPRSSSLGTFRTEERHVAPRETSPATKSEDKRTFSQATDGSTDVLNKGVYISTTRAVRETITTLLRNLQTQ